jgi:hypothetical protein
MLMENTGGTKEVISATPEQAEQKLFGPVETLPSVEIPNATGESIAPLEQPGTILSMPPKLPDVGDAMDDAYAIMPEVERNAESMSKQYVKKVTEIVRENKKDPYKLQERVDALKDHYLKGAFDRVRGQAA